MKKIYIVVLLTTGILLGGCNKQNANNTAVDNNIQEESSIPEESYSFPADESTEPSMPQLISGNLGTPAVFTTNDGGEFEITLSDPKKENPDDFHQAKNGQLIRLELAVNNNGSTEVSVNIHELSIYDGNDTKGEITSKDYFSETIAPGKNATGSIVFDAGLTGPFEVHMADVVWSFELP